MYGNERRRNLYYITDNIVKEDTIDAKIIVRFIEILFQPWWL